MEQKKLLMRLELRLRFHKKKTKKKKPRTKLQNQTSNLNNYDIKTQNKGLCLSILAIILFNMMGLNYQVSE